MKKFKFLSIILTISIESESLIPIYIKLSLTIWAEIDSLYFPLVNALYQSDGFMPNEFILRARIERTSKSFVILLVFKILDLKLISEHNSAIS